MSEIWKPVPGYEGYYEVSDEGRVKRLAGWVKHRFSPFWRDEHILADYTDKKGYCPVRLSIDGVSRSFKKHRLVMLAFVGPCPSDGEVCHNDGTRTNNRLNNLRYDTKSGNQLDRRKHGTATGAAGELHGKHKLTDEDVRYIRSYPRHRGSGDELARMFSVGKSAISGVRNYRNWCHLD